jgi:hypothetical protein
MVAWRVRPLWAVALVAFMLAAGPRPVAAQCLSAATRRFDKPPTSSSSQLYAPECVRVFADQWRSAYGKLRVCCDPASGHAFTSPTKGDMEWIFDDCSFNRRDEKAQDCKQALFGYACELACSPRQRDFLEHLTVRGAQHLLQIRPRCGNFLWEQCSTLDFKDPSASRGAAQCRPPTSQEVFLAEVLNATLAIDPDETEALGDVCPTGLLTGEILGIVFGSVGFVLLLCCGVVGLWLHTKSGSVGAQTTLVATTVPTQHTSDDSSSSSSGNGPSVAVGSPPPAFGGPPAAYVAAGGAIPPQYVASLAPPQFTGAGNSSSSSYSSRSGSGSDTSILGDDAWGDDDAPPPAYDSSTG